MEDTKNKIIDELKTATGVEGKYVDGNQYEVDIPDSDTFAKTYQTFDSADGLKLLSTDVTENGVNYEYTTDNGNTLHLNADFLKDVYTATVDTGKDEPNEQEDSN